MPGSYEAYVIGGNDRNRFYFWVHDEETIVNTVKKRQIIDILTYKYVQNSRKGFD